MADPLLQTPKSLLDAGASSSSHPTPRLPLSTHYPGGLSAATTNREIPFSNQVVGSFLNRYYGMYSIEMFGQKIYFVVMENLLPQGTVSEVYDLKVGGVWGEGRLTVCRALGSTASRTSRTTARF